jgi:hypothetical protein
LIALPTCMLGLSQKKDRRFCNRHAVEQIVGILKEADAVRPGNEMWWKSGLALRVSHGMGVKSRSACCAGRCHTAGFIDQPTTTPEYISNTLKDLLADLIRK